MATQPLQFKKAVKYDARGRVALVGPAGSGKSYTMLTLARALAGPKGTIAAIDTEHGSLSKYADLFEFDVIELDSFTPENFQAALTAAEQAKYDVFVCDSLSHFWVGRDGALEFVDMASKRYKDQMGGWKDFRPHERSMVDRMVASPCHVIVTMRTKTEYSEQVDERGKKKRVKVGLQPVQREGLEYEFDLVGYMDESNTFLVDKTRCPHYTDKALTRPGAKEFEPFLDWLKGAKRDAAPAAAPAARAPAPARQSAPAAAWDWRIVLPHFERIEQRIGAVVFKRLLGAEGYECLETLPDYRTAGNVYKAVLAASQNLPDFVEDDPFASIPAPAAPPRGQVVQMPVAEKPKAEAPVQGMPAALEAMWKRMNGIKGVCEVLGELKADLIELIGEERALEKYSLALVQYGGVEHANQFRNLGKARKCASGLYEIIQALHIPPCPDITDDDLPSGDPPAESTLFDNAPMAPYGVN